MKESLLSVGGLTLERLRNFCLVADAGSLTKVAEGNPAKVALLSRQLKELEAFFGVELRRRKGNGLVLTEAGRRLAALAREQLAGLDDFKRWCSACPLELTIAAGNSILEWLILPRIATLQGRLPGTNFRLVNMRTADAISGLVDQTVDLSIVRSDSVGAGLRSLPLLRYQSCLFVPKDLAKGLTAANLRKRIGDLPVATSAGGQFRTRLQESAAKAQWNLQISLSCSSFTQAARAVETGAFAAVLPEIAHSQFEPKKVEQFELPFLKDHERQVVIAWNPRMTVVRPILVGAVDAFAALLASAP